MSDTPEETSKKLAAKEERTPRQGDADVEAQRAKVRLLMEELQFEELQERVASTREAKRQRVEKSKSNEANLAAYRRDQEKLQKICNHKKGGKDKFYKGSDAQYAVAKNVYPLGNLDVMCTRCHKQWKMPPLELRRENPALYKALLEDYQWAIDLPTDNEQSGTQIFSIEIVRD